LRLRVVHQNGQSGGGVDFIPRPRAPRLRRVTFLAIALTFRIAPAAGALSTTFSGAPDPFCRALDSCGSSGQVGYAFPTRGGRVGLRLASVLHGPAPVGLRAALAQVLRGHHYAYGDAQLKPARGITTTERITQGALTCSDIQPATLAAFDVHVGARHVAFDLSSSDYESVDNLRTRCPGPSERDRFPRGVLARGGLPLTAMLSPRPRAVLRGGGLFSTGGYTGSTRGGVVLDMHRIRARVRAITVRVPPGALP
jgi:hypothetical protein